MVDPTADGSETQCWCERKPQYIPSICADDGADCLCNGEVIYGEKYPEHKDAEGHDHDDERRVNAIVATKQPWTVNDANNTGHIACASYNFEDVDPLPHLEKQCFCDEKKIKINYNLEQSVKEYWRQKRKEAELQEAKIRATALAEEAKKKAEEERKEEEERLKAEKEAREKRLK